MQNKSFVIWILNVLLISACGGHTTATPEVLETVPAEFAGQTNPFGAEVAPKGEEFFQTYCASCHGETGRGDGPASGSLAPPPKDLIRLHPLVGDDYLFWRISEGKRGTAMVAWKGILTDDQIWQVVSFIRTLK